MAFAVLLFNSGARFAIGLLLPPMETELGWSRTLLSSLVTVFMVISAGFLPFAGRLVDRLGAKRVLSFGVALSGVSLGVMAFVELPIEAFLLYGVLFAIGSAATSITPIGVLLSRWYPDRLGMANSVAISGMGLGQLILIAGLSAQLLTLGWRGSFLLLGVLTVACVLPLVMLAKEHNPQSTAEAPSAPGAPERLGTVMARGRFWLIVFVYAVCGFQDFLIATHVVAFALEEDMAIGFAGNLLALMGLMGLIGVLAAGALDDRYGPVVPTAVNFIIRIVIFGLMLVSRDPIAIAVMALLYGSTFWITAPLVVVFAKWLCHIGLLGLVSGIVTMIHHMFGGLGAIVGAGIYDLTGSYDNAMVLMLVLSIIGLLACSGLRSPKPLAT